MSIFDALSPEQKHLLLSVIEDWTGEIFFRGPETDTDALFEGIEWLYSTCRFKRPKLFVLNSPVECHEKLQQISELDQDRRDLVVPVVLSADFRERSGVTAINHLAPYMKFLKAGCFLSVFSRNNAVICRRPVALNFNPEGQFHCADGPAFEWRDGWKGYYLNGVRVSPQIVETPADKMDMDLFLRESNIEMKREIVRKVGAERLIQKLGGRLIDHWQDYELIQLDIPGMRLKPTYLKMKNPSIGTWHVEGVPPQVRTCRQALSWRVGGLKWNPSQLA